MLQNPNNNGKVLCSKCQTYFGAEYSNCPFCGSTKSTPVASKGGPTETDLKLVQLLRGLNDVQKEGIIRFIENNF